MARLQAQLDSLVSKEDNRRVREQREAVTETEKDVQSLSPAPASELSVETNQRSALVHQQKHMLSVEALLQGIDLKALSSGAGSRMAAGKSHLHQPTHQHKVSDAYVGQLCDRFVMGFLASWHRYRSCTEYNQKLLFHFIFINVSLVHLGCAISELWYKESVELRPRGCQRYSSCGQWTIRRSKSGTGSGTVLSGPQS